MWNQPFWYTPYIFSTTLHCPLEILKWLKDSSLLPLSSFMHCPVPWPHVREKNREDEATPKPWTLGLNLTCKTWFFPFALCRDVCERRAWKWGLKKLCGPSDTGESIQFCEPMRSHSDPVNLRLELTIQGGRNSLGRALVWESRHLALPLASCVFGQSYLLLWASVSPSVRESPPPVGFWIAQSWC